MPLTELEKIEFELAKRSQSSNQEVVSSPEPQEQRTAEGALFPASGAPLVGDEIFPLAATRDLVRSRGTLDPEAAFQKMVSGGAGNAVMGGLELIADPFRRLEASISNPALAIQRGDISPAAVFDEFKQGVSGQKLGEAGDIARATGLFPEPVSATLGLTASLVAPLKVIEKTLGKGSKLTKFSDKGIKAAGDSLVKGSDDAVKALGKRLDDAYQPINNIPVNPAKFIDDVKALPKKVLNDISREMGESIDDVLSNMNIQKARKLKGLLGELQSGSFGKKAKGAVQKITDKNVNRAFRNIKGSMQDSLKNTRTIGTNLLDDAGDIVEFSKNARKLLDADDAFVQAKRASDFIKSRVVDKKLLKPTKGGSVARGLQQGGDTTTREALKILRKTGSTAKKEIDRAVGLLRGFNTFNNRVRTLKRISDAALLGGAAGAAGGKALRAIGGE